ncbi:MAG: AI-2E family transporter [Peptostreptococcaceae bacterium]
MLSKQSIKYFIFAVFIGVLIYKLIDAPSQLIIGIGDLVSFLSPFLIGILLTLLLDPLVMFFENKLKLKRLINIFISYMLILLIFMIGFKIFIPIIVDTLNTIITQMQSYIDLIDKLLGRFIEEGDLPKEIIPHIQNTLNSILTQLINLFSKSSSDVLVYILSITSVVFDVIMGVILSIYILFDKERISYEFKRFLYALFDKTKADSIIQLAKMSHNIFYHYLIGQIIVSLVVGVISYLSFKFIIKIDSSLFLSFIIFLTNMIPYFGPFIGAILPILMTLVYSPIKALWVALFIILLQQIDGNFISPKIMGDQMGLSPIWIISSILIGGSLFGFIGVFLSVPTAAVIKAYINKFIEKRLSIKKSR